MKICILGKYPPIEGGVSTHTYWLARGLAARGHQVCVVTNAYEVEEMYRIHLDADDRSFCEPCFDGGGWVRVFNPEPFGRRAMGYIPEANPFVSRLASLATDVIRHHCCEVILAYYLEPYVVAGWLASRWTGRPLIAKHAGSDLDRLMRVSDLATTYKEILRTADGVVTQPRLMPRFLGMGVRRSRLHADVAYGVPRDFFNSGAAPLEPDRLRCDIGIGEPRPFDVELPTIGVYGKIGTSKGTFDLITALGLLARDGLRFNFLAMIGQAQGEVVATALRDAGLADRSYILPLLANWRVPSFVRRCTAVCFLEREFPVEIHGPIIAREVLACATCLVLSGEIVTKQRYRDSLTPGENILVVADPKDVALLADCLRGIVNNPQRARAIGDCGERVVAPIEDGEAYIDGWELILAAHASANALPTAPAAAALPIREALEATVPDLLDYLERRCPALVEAFFTEVGDAAPVETAERFCAFADSRLPDAVFGSRLPALRSALRYTRARVRAAHDPVDDCTPLFPAVDRLGGRPPTRDTAGNLWPIRGNAVKIETFDHDVSGLFCRATLFGQPVAPVDEVDRDLTAVPDKPIMVLFQRRPNLIACELQIDDPVRELVGACDGRRTTQQLLEHLCDRFGVAVESEREVLAERLLASLERLYRAGVVVFGARDADGWAGGDRGRTEGL